MSHTKQAFKTGRGPCPATGTKRWSYLGREEEPSLIVSYGTFANPPRPEWVSVGESSSGGAMFVYKGKGHTPTDSVPVSEHPARCKPTTITQSADATLKNRVYHALLQFCPITPSHRAHLVRRKLSYPQLRSLLTFGSLPHPRLRPELASQLLKELNLSVEELLTVPGFFLNTKNHLSISGAEGLLIPSLDHKGRIQALQIRKDKPGSKDSRYTWMSSASKGGPGSGAPACFLGDNRANTLWITEGAFKGAALLLHGWAEATLSVAGVGNIESVLVQLEELPEVRSVIVAYDADWKVKPGVLRGLARLVEALQRRKLDVQAVGWDPNQGKGIDDAIVAGLSQQALFPLPLDGLLRAARKARVSSHRLNTEGHMPVWEPPTEQELTLEDLRQQTSYEIYHALRKPYGTFTSIAANTGSGKTYSTIRNSPTQTLFVFRNYAALEEAEHELRSVHGPGKVRVLYGRIAPPSQGSDIAAHRRFERAGCLRYGEMKKRSERGHSPCLGCPFAPNFNSSPEDNDEQSLCPYWEQRLETVNNPTPYLCAVTQSFAYNPSLLSLLPDNETRSFFGEYNQLVLDDCPEFVSCLTRERSLTSKDLEQWLSHPEFSPSDLEHQELVDWLHFLHRWLREGSPAPELERQIRTLSSAVAQQEEPFCEQPYDETWPLRAVHTLATWLARNGEVRFEEEKGQRTLVFLQPAFELIERLCYMTVCHLDATPDEPLLRWFSQLASMNFEAPEMKRVFPRIIQVPDILWDRSQIQSRNELIHALTSHVHQEGGIVLGFKNREGEEEHHIDLDGHWGFSERGLNCYTGVQSVALLGHYALPLVEVQSVAWRLRALAKSMDALPPDTFLHERFAEERRYSDGWRPWTRTMHVANDRVVEHLRRHRHTSGVVQGANRSRNLDAPVYLLSGEPLDGLPWDLPVALYTSQEFVALLKLDRDFDTAPARVIHPVLERINQERAQQAKERLRNALPGARNYAAQLGRVPGIRELRLFLGKDGSLANQDLAEKVREQLLQERGEKESKEVLARTAGECSLLPFENGVPDSPHKNQRDFKAKFLSTFSKLEKSIVERCKEKRFAPLPVGEEKPLKPQSWNRQKDSSPNAMEWDEPFPDVRALTPYELNLIPPLARVRMGLCDPGVDNGWNRDVIRQIARSYQVEASLLYRFIGAAIPPRYTLV